MTMTMRARVGGVIGLPAARVNPGAGRARRAVRKRSLPGAAWLASPIPERPKEVMVISGPMPASPMARSLPARSPMPESPMLARANLTRASEMAGPRGLGSIATTAARSVPTRHAARVFGKTATVRSVRGRKVTGLMARVRRARVVARSVRIRRAGIVPSVTRKRFHAVDPSVARADRARSSATARGVTGATKSRGRSATPARAMIAAGRDRLVTVRGVHDFRSHARIALSELRAPIAVPASLIVRKAIVRVMTVAPMIALASIARDRIVPMATVLVVPAMPGRSARAGLIVMIVPVAMIVTIVRVVTMRTTARFSQNVRRSGDAAPIANARLTASGVARGPSRNQRKPVNASRK